LEGKVALGMGKKATEMGSFCDMGALGGDRRVVWMCCLFPARGKFSLTGWGEPLKKNPSVVCCLPGGKVTHHSNSLSRNHQNFSHNFNK